MIRTSIDTIQHGVSQKTSKNSIYDAVKSPDVPRQDIELEDGALRTGGAPDLFSTQYIGMLAQYAGVGMMLGTLPSLAYPFLFNYLQMEITQVVSARVIMNLPWSLKVFLGMLTDCIAINGYRRRPFMCIGWSLCCLMLFIMALKPVEDPYFPDFKYALMPPDAIPDEVKATFNEKAKTSGGPFILYMALASIGYVGADVAADAVVVELAQREPENIRGRTQTTIYFIRAVFMVVASVLVAFAFNGEEYGGDFDFSLSFPMLMALLGLFCLPIIPISWFFIAEEKHEGMKIGKYFSDLWLLIQSRPVYQVIAYKFISSVFDSIRPIHLDGIAQVWVEATPFNDRMISIVGNGIYAAILYLMGKYGLHWNWHVLLISTLLSLILIDGTVLLLTTWNVIREQWFFLGVPMFEAIPSAMKFLVSTYIVVELAGEGSEGATYGLLTTVGNMAMPFAQTLSKHIGSAFHVTADDIRLDTTDVRWHSTYLILLCYSLNLLSLLFLPLLPTQKNETQSLIKTGGRSKLMGIITIIYCSFCLCWTIAVNFLSIYPSTQCLVVVGGKGC